MEMGRSGIDCTECDCENVLSLCLSFLYIHSPWVPLSQAKKKFLAFLTCVPLGSIQCRMVLRGKRLSGNWGNAATRRERIVFVIQYMKSSFQADCCSFIC